MPDEAVLEEVRAWFRRAESDRKAIEILLSAHDSPSDIICYHAQPLAEKCLKGLLTHRGIPFPRTHDLAELQARLPDDCPATRALGDLSELTDAAVSSRYPDDLVEYDRETAERLARMAGEVLEAVRHDLPSMSQV